MKGVCMMFLKNLTKCTTPAVLNKGNTAKMMPLLTTRVKNRVFEWG
jgi:hypothetical protein